MLIFVVLFIQVVDGQAGLIQQVAWVHVVQEVKPQQEIAPTLHNAMGVHFAIQTIHQQCHMCLMFKSRQNTHHALYHHVQ